MSNLVGQLLGRYQIIEQLGLGGMAAVYKAQDTRLERYVAIKVIRADQFAPAVLEEVMKRFEREAKALAKLSHPNIVQVYDFGEYEGAPYLVMEYVPGGTLKDRYDKPMPWQQAVQLLLPIANALAYAHEHNIVHRDIKPANVLLTDEGTPMLSDFGIAKILENKDGSTLTSASMIIGTPEYMAPEQWTGVSGPQSDIYSLGVVLYELIVGRKPYTADTPMSIMLKQMNEPLPHPSQFVHDLPKGLENVLIKALERQPADRYQSMDEFAAALDASIKEQAPSTGVVAGAIQAGKTLLAKNFTVQRTMPVEKPEDVSPRLSVDPAPEAAFPTNGRRQLTPSKKRHWMSIGVLVVFLCIGIIGGANLVFRDARSNAASIVTPSLPEVSSPTLMAPQAVFAASTPSTPSGLPHSTVKVLWDVSHGPRTGNGGASYTADGMYKSLAQTLTNDHFEISSSDLSDLNSYDILVISEMSGSTPFTLTELNQIEQFVRRSGHALLILSDTPDYENLADTLANRFSIHLGESNTGGPTSLTDSPLFSGVSSIKFLNGGGIFLISPPAQSAATDQNGNTVIASCECGNGRVIAISSAQLWDNDGIKQADNGRFALNVFEWLAKSSP